MTHLDLKCLHEIENGLLEGPRFDAKSNMLIFSDARNGGVLGLDSQGQVKTLIAHRRGIGGVALHEKGGCVVTGRTVAYKPFDVNGQALPTINLIDRDEATNRVGFNDLAIDKKGRIYVGSMGFVAMEADIDDPSLPPGTFWLIELDGSYRAVADDIRITNGTAISEDERVLYLSDSGRKAVLAFDIDSVTGDLKNRRLFCNCPSGVPDGMAIAEDGSLWLTLAYAGKIIRYDKSGAVMQEFNVPDSMVTSVCFGGNDLRTLYVVTGAEGKDPKQKAHVFSCRVDVAGIPVHYAKTPTEIFN